MNSKMVTKIFGWQCRVGRLVGFSNIPLSTRSLAAYEPVPSAIRFDVENQRFV